MHLKKLLKIDDGSSSDPEKRLHRGDPGRQQTFGIVVDGGVPHRGNRGQADVDQAASHRHVLRQPPFSATAR